MAQSSNNTALQQRASQCLLQNYARYPIAIIKGKGSEIVDADGKQYIDMFAGFGAGGILGHAHAELVETIATQAMQLTAHGNVFYNEPQIELAEQLVREFIGSRVFFCHSGAEAAEAALKTARKARPGRHKLLCFEHGFHGRTMGALALCPPSFQEGFEPMLPGVVAVPHGDISKVAAAIDDQTAAIFIEPIQGEGGLRLPPPDYLHQLRLLCDERGVLLVFDEVWTAPGRTGKFFAWQHFGVKPDIITMAKALGAGLPLAACLIAEPYAEAMGPGSHGCTLGGNPLCSAASLTALRIMNRDFLIDRAARLGEDAQRFFRELDLPIIKEFRGLGLFFGIELDSRVEVKQVVQSCLDKGVFVAGAKQNVLRFAPAMNIPEELFNTGLATVASVLQAFNDTM